MTIYKRNKTTYLTDATPGHVMAMANHLRPADLAEVYAVALISGRDALALSYDRSAEALTLVHRRQPVAMFGVSRQTLLLGGTIWMLATRDFEQIRFPFARYCRQVIGVWLDRYGYLENYVDARNTLSLHWLRWCGFTIEQAAPLGALGLPFHHFYMAKGG